MVAMPVQASECLIPPCGAVTNNTTKYIPIRWGAGSEGSVSPFQSRGGYAVIQGPPPFYIPIPVGIDVDYFGIPPSCWLSWVVSGFVWDDESLPLGPDSRWNSSVIDNLWIKFSSSQTITVTGFFCTPTDNSGDNPPQPPSPPPPSPSPASSIGVKRNDYNRDGVSDIVAVRDGLLHRWYGNGNGGFTYGGSYGGGWTPYTSTLAAVGDINRDNVGDLIAVRDDCLHRWYGNGNGNGDDGFNYGGTSGCGWTPYANSLIGVGDVNQDGVGDLVAVRDGCLHRWYGDGNGGFSYGGTSGCGWAPYAGSLTGVGDLNRDGVGDLISVRDDYLHRWYGNGNGGFDYGGTYGHGWTPYASTLAGMGDINRDGIGDVLAIREGYLYTWQGTGTGTVNFTSTHGNGWGAYVLAD
jgi:hypothetical protein